MSTRATYTICTEYTKLDFYIHHDGYPHGAAVYFFNMHLQDGPDPITRFAKANDRASATDAEAHGDTEYHYVLGKNMEITAFAIYRDEDDIRQRKQIGYWQHYSQFINQHCAEMIEDFEPILPVEMGRYNKNLAYYTRTQLLLNRTKKLTQLNEYAEKFPQHTGNINAHKSDVENIEQQIQQYELQIKAA